MKALLLAIFLSGCAGECYYTDQGEQTGPGCYGKESTKGYTDPTGPPIHNAAEYQVVDIKLNTYSEVRAVCDGKDGCITIDREAKIAWIYRVYGADKVLRHELQHISHGAFHHPI